MSFEIYTGKDGEKEDGSAVGIVDRLIREANLTAQGTGRILYTDKLVHVGKACHTLV